MTFEKTDVLRRAFVKESAGNCRSEIIHESLTYFASIYRDYAKSGLSRYNLDTVTDFRADLLRSDRDAFSEGLACELRHQ